MQHLPNSSLINRLILLVTFMAMLLGLLIYDKIDTIIQRISDEEGFDMVFDVVQGVIVFAKPEWDITDRVLEELNKGS